MKKAALVLLAALPALAACGSAPAAVPYTLQPAAPAAASPTGPDATVEPTLELAGDTPGSSTVSIVLTWQNTSTTDFRGTLESRVLAPTGFRIAEDSGCVHALVNNLVCRFDGAITAGNSVSRTLTYHPPKPGDLPAGEYEFTVPGSDASLGIVIG